VIEDCTKVSSNRINLISDITLQEDEEVVYGRDFSYGQRVYIKKPYVRCGKISIILHV
jgi:hypothetical protein